MKTVSCIKWLWRASEGVRGKVAACSFIGLLHVAASMTFVWVCKQLIDTATSGDGNDLPLYIVMMASCMLVQIVLSAVEQRILNLGDVTLKNGLRQKLFGRLMESRWDGKEVFHTGDTLNRVLKALLHKGLQAAFCFPYVHCQFTHLAQISTTKYQHRQHDARDSPCQAWIKDKEKTEGSDELNPCSNHCWD